LHVLHVVSAVVLESAEIIVHAGFRLIGSLFKAQGSTTGKLVYGDITWLFSCVCQKLLN